MAIDDLDRLYEWLTTKRRESADKKFTSGRVRMVAREMEYLINKAKNDGS